MTTLFTILAVLFLIILVWFVVWHVIDRILNPFRVTLHYESGAKARTNLKEVINRNPQRFQWETSIRGRSYLVGMVGADPVAITAVDRRRTLFYR